MAWLATVEATREFFHQLKLERSALGPGLRLVLARSWSRMSTWPGWWWLGSHGGNRLLIRTCEGGHFVRLQVLGNDLLRALINSLMSNPINQWKKFEPFDIWPAVHLCPQRIWKRAHKHYLRVVRPHTITELKPKVQFLPSRCIQLRGIIRILVVSI